MNYYLKLESPFKMIQLAKKIGKLLFSSIIEPTNLDTMSWFVLEVKLAITLDKL